MARLLRGASERKLSRVTPYAFPIDLARSRSWLGALSARELLMGHLHRKEHHAHDDGTATLMLPGEMGERFKALALIRGIHGPLAGFGGRDLSESL